MFFLPVGWMQKYEIFQKYFVSSKNLRNFAPDFERKNHPDLLAQLV